LGLSSLGGSSGAGPDCTFGAATLITATSKNAVVMSSTGMSNITKFITGMRFGSSSSSSSIGTISHQSRENDNPSD
jgi:hypothetical protein